MTIIVLSYYYYYLNFGTYLAMLWEPIPCSVLSSDNQQCSGKLHVAVNI